MIYNRVIFSLVFIFAALVSLQAHDLPPGFASVQVAEGLDPVDMAIAPDGRLFLTEKSGRILLVENGILQPDPFLEIPVDNFNERGLSGIALDPDFANNYYIYVYYTVPGADHNRISRFKAGEDFAVPGSEEILFELDMLNGPHHNAGAMNFGNDGKLYVAVGDGTSNFNSQEMSTVLGKVLRLNPDGSIPADNPFYDEVDGNNRAIWALGLRNPFAMDVQPGTGRIFTTDVGSSFYEEINEIFGGKNYGFSEVEGFLNGQTPPANYQDPVYAYGRSKGCAAVGVAFYNPETVLFPDEYVGKVFYSEYCGGYIGVLDPATGQSEYFATNVARPLNLLTAPDGTLYFIARAGLGGGSPQDNTSTTNGSLWRVFYTGNNAPFVAVQPKSVLVSNGENASFITSASGADPLFFQWQRDGVDIPGANTPELIYENAVLSDSGSVFRCIITNAEGADTTINAELRVTSSHRPLVTILSPADGSVYRAGDTIFFEGVAVDEEEGNLTGDKFRWKVDFQHNNHTHPALGPVTGIDKGQFVVPKIGEVSHNVRYRFTLSVTDESGLAATVRHVVEPVKTDLILKTDPPGFPVETDGHLSATPYSVRSVVGIIHDLKAPLTQVTSDSLYKFKRWSFGEEQNPVLFETPDDTTTVTAIYEPLQALSDGQGLKAYYYDDVEENATFVEPFIFSRIDPEINFEWGSGSPDEEYLGTDRFLVRWEGSVQPFFDDTLNFHTISDDGVRLWVDDHLIIDHWKDQGAAEHSGQIYLKGGQYYPIRLEYYENGGEAIIQLLWSSEKVGRDFIPVSQLFPQLIDNTFEGNKISLDYYPNPVADVLNIELGSPVETSVTLEIFLPTGQRVHHQEVIIPPGLSVTELDFNLSNGVYFVKLSGELIDRTIEILRQ